MQVGSAWTKTEEKEGKKIVTGISVTLEDAVLELFPQLKSVRFVLKPIPAEQRKKDQSPHWRLQLYKPQENTSNGTTVADEDIPF